MAGSGRVKSGLRIEYFTFEVNGRQTGLIRRVWDDVAETLEDQCVDGALRRWVADPSLVRHFYPLDYDLVAIDEARAAELAAGYGCTLALPLRVV